MPAAKKMEENVMKMAEKLVKETLASAKSEIAEETVKAIVKEKAKRKPAKQPYAKLLNMIIPNVKNLEDKTFYDKVLRKPAAFAMDISEALATEVNRQIHAV